MHIYVYIHEYTFTVLHLCVVCFIFISNELLGVFFLFITGEPVRCSSLKFPPFFRTRSVTNACMIQDLKDSLKKKVSCNSVDFYLLIFLTTLLL